MQIGSFSIMFSHFVYYKRLEVNIVYIDLHFSNIAMACWSNLKLSECYKLLDTMLFLY